MIKEKIQKLNIYFQALSKTELKPLNLLVLSINKLNGNLFAKQKWVKNLKPKTIIDIGANTGQAAKEFRKNFPKAKIYSFEPLPECYKKLTKFFSGDKNFKSYCYALGKKTENKYINVNEFNPSSSLLNTSKTGRKLYPQIKKATKLKIKVRSLDSFKFEKKGHTFIKIDVQGFEDNVIRGGIKTIKKSSIVIIETSFVKIYENQPLFGDIYKKLTNLGFSFVGFSEVYVNPKTSFPLFCDSVFISSQVKKQLTRQNT